MASEADIIARESGGNPYIGYGGVDLSQAPRDKYGFPIWEGRMGPAGISHAAGLHQWEPATWAEAAQALGLKDFSEASQHQAFDYMHAKYGDKPWAASEPLKPGEHRWLGDPTRTDQGLNLGTLEKSFAAAGAAEPPPGLFLDALLKPKDQVAPEMEVPGSRVLDQLLAQPPQEAAGEQKPTGAPIPPPDVSARPAPSPAAIPQVHTDPIANTMGQHFLDGLLSGASTGLAERPSGAPPEKPLSKPLVPQMSGQTEQQPEMSPQQGGDILDRLLTTAGEVPSRDTDTGQVEREQQTGEPIIGVGEGGELTGRLPEMAEALTPYILGAAPAGTASAGMRLPRGRGGLPARIEPQAPSTAIVPRGGEVLPPEPEMRLGGAGGGLPPPGGRSVGPVEGGAPEPPPNIDVNAQTDAAREPRTNKAGESQPMVQHRLQAMRQTQDKLWTLQEQANEYRNRVLRAFSSEDMPTLSGEEKLQVERYLEWQPGMPQVAAPSPAAMKVINEVIKPAQRQAARDYEWLKSEGVVDNLSDEQLDELTAGYIHRLAAGKSGSKFEPFGGTRSLRQKTSAMRGRQLYALQHPDGTRTLERGTPPGPYGSKVQTNRGESEVRRATTEEIEAQTDVRYLHDPVLATLQNMTELHIARQNVEALKRDILPALKDEGLAVTDAEAARQLGFKPSKVPALRGHWFEQRLANAFDDFYQSPGLLNPDFAQALGWLDSINRFAIGSMFANPLGHMRNVTGDAILARGDLWYSPKAWVQGTRHMRDAFNDVRTMSPFYRQVMRVGGALKYIGVENRIAYESLLAKARDEMTRLPNLDREVAQTGVWKTTKDMAEAFWNAGQKFMWGYHDMLYLQRVRELMARGMDMKAATQEAQRFIASYRVPASVGEGGVLRIPKSTARALSILHQDHTLTVFGKYRYDKLKAIANVLRDAGKAMSRSGMTPAQRAEALKRLGTMLLISTGLQYGINFALQQATGNPEARAHVPGALGIPANAARVASDLYKGDFGEAGWDFAMGMASIISPLPMVSEAIGQYTNTDFPVSSAPIRGHELPGWEQWLQSGAHAVEGSVPLLSDVTRMIEGKGIGSLGISLPDPAAVAAARAPHPMEFRREQRKFYRQFPWLQP